MNNLKDLYIDQLQDSYSACEQSRAVTIELEKAATNAELREALHAGHKGISDGMDMLRGLIEGHGESATGEHCKGMQGLVAEARAHALERTFGDDATRDAMIITQYQRMAHYAIAAYGCCKTFATRLGLTDEAAILDEHLGHTYSGDERMTEIATNGINADSRAA